MGDQLKQVRTNTRRNIKKKTSLHSKERVNACLVHREELGFAALGSRLAESGEDLARAYKVAYKKAGKLTVDERAIMDMGEPWVVMRFLGLYFKDEILAQENLSSLAPNPIVHFLLFTFSAPELRHLTQQCLGLS
jgi:hypothetical protein